MVPIVPRSIVATCVNARRNAQGADIVVVNHHLLMADLVLKEEGFGDLLPGADAIVIDEAHQLPEVAANFLGFTVSSRQLQSLARDLASELLLAGPAASRVCGVLCKPSIGSSSICRIRCAASASVASTRTGRRSRSKRSPTCALRWTISRSR